MRYYSIIIEGAPSAFPPVPGASRPGAQWDTFINGRHNPEAQQIELSIEEHTPTLGTDNPATITIHGVAWEQVKQAANLVGKPIAVYGGMSPGLPLATHQTIHSGLLASGLISKCWGNWVGNDMSIGIVFLLGGQAARQGAAEANAPSSSGGGQGASGGSNVISENKLEPQLTELVDIQYNRIGFRSIDKRQLPRSPAVSPMDFDGFGWTAGTANIGGIVSSFFGGGGTIATPLNMIHNMMPNMPLSGAIQETLGRAFPNAKLEVNISPGLKLGYQEAGMYQNMPQYAARMKELSHSIMGIKNYLGVHMTSYSDTIRVFDGTSASGASIVDWMDLIGQPTWIDPLTINFKTVMRADLHVNWHATLPSTLFTTGPGAQVDFAPASMQRASLTFAGDFKIMRVLHIGDFRNPDGNNWSTNYEAIVLNAITGGPETSIYPQQPQSQGTVTVRPFTQAPQPQSRLLTRGVRRF